jgi:hypothetical protein
LVLGDSHAAAAAAVLSTLHTCSVRRPQGDSTTSFGQQQRARQERISCMAAVASMPHLGQLQLELQLPQQQQCAWAAAVDGLAGMCQLTSLQLHLSFPQQQQWQQLQQHLSLAHQQLAALFRAVGSLRRCKRLSIRLVKLPSDSESAASTAAMAAQHMAISTGTAPSLLPDAPELQPLVHLSSCLQSLQVTSQHRLPATALAHIACMSQLTGLHLECSCCSSSSSDTYYGKYEDLAAAALLPVMPQLQQLALIGYFQHPQQQQQQHALLPQQGSSSSSPLMSLLQQLQPSKVTALDLGYNSQGCLLFPAASHALAELTGLRSLGLAGAAVTAADLAAVGLGLQHLTRLDLSLLSSAELAEGLAGDGGGGGIDRYGTAVLPLQRWLGHCSDLQELLLCGRAVTARDIRAVLQQLPQLTFLDLSGAPVGASHLAQGLCFARGQGGSNSSQLSVNSRPPGDPSGTAARLVRLSLRGIRLGADGLQELAAAAAAAAAETAGLAGSRRSSSSSLGQLRELDLRGCRAGGAAVAALRRALPGLQVVQLDGMDWAEQGLEWLIGDY